VAEEVLEEVVVEVTLTVLTQRPIPQAQATQEHHQEGPTVKKEIGQSFEAQTQ